MRPSALSSGGDREPFDWQKALESRPVTASAPCRIDMGGTLDIRTFSYPLQHLSPCTLSIALELRTTVRLTPYARGRIRIDSRGFKGADCAAGQAPYDHPLGLMFAMADVFRASGVQIRIQSDSPPRSALGGSSVAAVALAAALLEARRTESAPAAISARSVGLLAQAVEESVAGVPCGYQDQLAAVYGGVHAWRWVALPRTSVFQRQRVVPGRRYAELEERLLVAYCGIPHASRDINGRWVRQFVSGRTRKPWEEIVRWTHRFVEALKGGDYGAAADAMNRETAVRRHLTPEVLDEMGRRLVAAARRGGCGARFTGAGGGGCLWALGAADAVARLRPRWQEILGQRPGACLLDARLARQGLRIEKTLDYKKGQDRQDEQDFQD
jgi:D-glycero-alpha-D-manno-heptose-7-phosphate kinase